MRVLIAMLIVVIPMTSVAAEYVTASVGGTGGGPYTTKCSTYKVMVGVQAKAGWYVDSIQPLCSGIYSDGKWNSEPVLEGMQAGGAGGAIIKLLCPRDYAVSGFQGKAGGWLERLQISCNPMGSNGLLTGSPSWISTIAGDGEGGTFGPFNFGPLYCQNQPGKGFTGNYGAFVDKVALICDVGIPTTTAITAVAVLVPQPAALTAPTLVSPADASTIDVTNGITFSWNANAPSGGYYQLCLTKDVINLASCDKWVANLTTTSKNFPRSELEALLNRALKWGVRTCNSSGSCSGFSWRSITKLTVPGFGWSTAITQDTLNSVGYPNSTHLLNKSIKQIINSNVSGRTDSPTPRLCNECHSANASKNYKPNTQYAIEPGTSIAKTSSTNTYTWNQGPTSGIIDAFCARVGASTDPKPGDLCEIFKKWRNGGYQP